jgi:hypothetical protein
VINNNARPWRALLFVLALLFITGTLAPLADIDLPMHLAVGEWIVRHGAVPHTEPFAWTRMGAPYFAYSWLAEVTFYELLEKGGPVALRLLNGVVFSGAFLAMFVAARAMRVSREACWLAGAFNIIMLLAISAFLRPQAFLFILLPLAWRAVVRAIERPHARGPLVALLLVSTIAANTHILFPLVAVPLVLCGLRDVSRARAAALMSVVIIGMLLSPYGLKWGSVFLLNFTPNALFGPRSLIAEYQPGFTGALFTGIILASLPLIVAPTLSINERKVYGALWLVGLTAFALRVKALVVWWFVSLPMVVTGAALALAGASRTFQKFPMLLTMALAFSSSYRFVVGGAAGSPALRDAWRAEHREPRRSLSTPGAMATEPLLAQLAGLHTPVRLLTVFDLGSYVPWRAPLVSESIDGRTIFPDSAALPDAALMPLDRARALGPWQSANAAMVPLTFPVAAVLDSASGWQRLATTSVDAPMGAIGLWVRRDWYAAVCRSSCSAQETSR